MRAGEPGRGLLACVEAGLAAERLFAQAEARTALRPGDRAVALRPPRRARRRRSTWSSCAATAPRRRTSRATPTTPSAGAPGAARGRSRDDPLRAGLLHERLGRYLWANGDAEAESIGAYRRAVELVPDTPSAERARVLTGLASALVYADRPDPSAWSEAGAAGGPGRRGAGEEGRALRSLGYCRAMAGDVEGGLAHCRQALDIAAELGQSDEHYRAYVSLVGVLRMAGRTAEAFTTAMDGVEVARRRGADRTYGNLLLGDAIEALILLGRWDEAQALLPDEPDVVAHGTPVIATNLWLSAANLHTWRGHFDRSQRFLDACRPRPMLGARPCPGHLHLNLSELCLWQGRYAEASGWIRKELDLLGTLEFTSLVSHLVVQGLRAEAGLARHADLDRLIDVLDEHGTAARSAARRGRPHRDVPGRAGPGPGRQRSGVVGRVGADLDQAGHAVAAGVFVLAPGGGTAGRAPRRPSAGPARPPWPRATRSRPGWAPSRCGAR